MGAVVVVVVAARAGLEAAMSAAVISPAVISPTINSTIGY